MMTSVAADISANRHLIWLRALADPLRMHIVRLLSREALCTCHIVEETGARQTNVSNHLRLLREAEIVDAESYGRYTYYRLRTDVVDQLAGYIGGIADAARAVDDGNRRRPCP